MTSKEQSIANYGGSSVEGTDLPKLRAQILASLGRSEAKSILIVPVSETDHGTPITVGVARAFATAGYKVMIIDAQFSSPDSHLTLKKDQYPGLAEVLINSSTNELTATQYVASNLELLAAGEETNRFPDLLASTAFENLLKMFAGEQKWTFIVGDSPTISPGVESMCQLVDTVILVGTHGKSRKRDAMAVRRSLQNLGASVLGIVLAEDLKFEAQ